MVQNKWKWCFYKFFFNFDLFKHIYNQIYGKK